ncbi:MAG: hypothetical protein ABI767_06905 [Rhodanobacter sp.]
MQFGTRVLVGGFCGAAIGLSGGMPWAGLVVGAIGAVLGSFGGAAARGTLTRRLGSDRPAALLEDVVAIVGATLAVAMLP